ncbi:transglycosylase domain-containing protein [Neisseria sp. Ec49-e6-T10]|uniref:transglycosylase domain-containing protein n=1 Tax=Neisseria sp. Ec49-e6-T10 TaxID=3140744 RepID=UPI003EB8FDAC
MKKTVKKLLKRILITLLSLVVLIISILGIIIMKAYSKLPPVDALATCRPRIDGLDQEWVKELGKQYQTCTKIEDFPVNLKNAVIAAEDKRFYQHSGVDIISIGRGIFGNIANKPVAGTSTIAHQISRQINLTDNNTSRSQFYMLLSAYKIEQNFSKDEILGFYLNQVYMGKKAYGFPIASQVYFGKNVSELTLAQSAMLASLPRGPSAFNPVDRPKRARARQMLVLENMKQLGFINQTQFDQAKNEVLVYKIAKTENNALGL